MAVIEKASEWIHISSAPSTTGNDLIVLNGHVVFGIVQSGVRLDDERKGKFTLLE